MQSHRYTFAVSDLLKLLCALCLPLALFGAAMRVGADFDLLPAPKPIFDMDSAVILHQARSAASDTNANLILVGDSSCLMDVDVRELDVVSGFTNVLNLGTLSYLDLDAYATLLQKRFSRDPRPTQAVVLLTHPEALRLGAPNPRHAEMLASFLASKDYCEPDADFACAAGMEIARGRLLSRIVPSALPGALGQFYGFTPNLWAYLDAHHGSAVDPGVFDAKTAAGNAEYRLSAHVIESSRRFRASLPPGVQLYLGITPAPAGFVPPNHAETISRILREWNAAIQADHVLLLPATMDDDTFASVTHLNARGQTAFSKNLAAALSAARGSVP